MRLTEPYRDHMRSGRFRWASAIAVLVLSQLMVAEVGAAAEGATLVGTVIKIVDGDGLKLQTDDGEVEVRLNGVDAPEMQQLGGREAKEFMSNLILGKSVSVIPVERDRYMRLIGRVYWGSTDVGAFAVSEGHAWAYRRYLTKGTAHYCRLEDQARSRRKGIWAHESPIYPYDWRRNRGTGGLTVLGSSATEESCSAETEK